MTRLQKLANDITLAKWGALLSRELTDHLAPGYARQAFKDVEQRKLLDEDFVDLLTMSGDGLNEMRNMLP